VPISLIQESGCDSLADRVARFIAQGEPASASSSGLRRSQCSTFDNGLLTGAGRGVADLFEADPETRVVVVSKLDSSCWRIGVQFAACMAVSFKYRG
jgi:hypothetical protein